MTPRLGWIGLGNMGYAMSANLAESIKPAELKVFNRTRARAEKLEEESSAIIDVCTTIDELVSTTDIIFICLSDDGALKSSIDTILNASDLKGKLVCDMSTVHPDTTRGEAKRLKAAGCHFVAAPVFGAPPVAVAGKLVVVKAGEPEAISIVDPFLPSMSRASLPLGTDPGLASLMKITGNSFILSMIETIAEGLTFSEVSGLGVDNTMSFLSTMFGGTPWESYANRMVTGGYMPSQGERPGFAVDVAHKDCSHALDLAKTGSPSYKMSILTHVQENLEVARKDKRYEGRGDVSSIYGVERERAGLSLQNEAVKKR